MIVRLDRAREALAKAASIQETKKIVDVAASMEIYAKRQQLSQEAIDYALSIKFDALRRLGEMLQSTRDDRAKPGAPRPGPGRGKHGTKTEPCFSEPPTLADLGVDKKTSSIAQRLAALPAEQFERVRAGTITVSKAIRTPRAVREKKGPVSRGPKIADFSPEVQDAIVEKVESGIRPADATKSTVGGTTWLGLPTAKFDVIFANPPWPAAPVGEEADGRGSEGGPARTIEDLCSVPVAAIAADDAQLLVRVPYWMLEQCFRVIRAWGFRYEFSVVLQCETGSSHGPFLVRHETLVICKRGRGVPEVVTGARFRSVLNVERSDEGDDVLTSSCGLIKDLYPTGSRIALFSGAPHDGWETWSGEPKVDTDGDVAPEDEGGEGRDVEGDEAA